MAHYEKEFKEQSVQKMMGMIIVKRVKAHLKAKGAGHFQYQRERGVALFGERLV